MATTLRVPLRGIIPPLVTPLAGPDALDVAGLERLIEHVLANGCAGLFVLGSTGEAPALSYRLRLEVVRRACEFAAGRVPVLAGISDTAPVESIRLGLAAAQAGAAALVTTAPYYFRLGQADLLRHTELLARELPLPIFLYNIPDLTKLRYEPETVRQAASIPGVAGFKDSSGDMVYLRQVLRLMSARPDFTVLIGPEELLARAVRLGAHGGIAGGANAWPGLYVSLYQAALANRTDEVRTLQRRVMRISKGIYHSGAGYLRGLKCALGVLGLCSDLPAPPLAPVAEPDRAAIRAHVESLPADLPCALSPYSS